MADDEPLFIEQYPPAHLLETIGALQNQWQIIEAYIDKMIWGLAGTDEIKGQAITQHMSVPLKRDVLRALYHAEFKDPKADTALNSLFENVLKPAQSARNKYAHALWLRNSAGDTVFLEKTERGKPYRKRTIVSKTEVEKDLVTAVYGVMCLVSFFLGNVDYAVIPDPMARPLLDAASKGKLHEHIAQVGQGRLEFHPGPAKPKKPRHPPQSSEAIIRGRIGPKSNSQPRKPPKA